MTGAYLHTEKLGDEQWIGAGLRVWQVIDPSQATPGNSEGVVHQAELIPVFKKLRCRLWGLFHGYGWLRVKKNG